MINCSDEVKQNMETQVYILLHKLQDWWWHFERAHRPLIRPMDNDFDIVGVHSSSELPVPSSAMHLYRDTLTATSIAIYNATSIVLYSVLLSLSRSKPRLPPEISPVPRYRSSISSHCASILSVASFQCWSNPYCGDTTRTIFPIRIVSLLAVEEAQAAEALSHIESLHYNIDLNSTGSQYGFSSGALF